MRLEADAESLDAAVPDHLLRTLQSSLTQSNAHGLLTLSTSDWPAELPATFAYWRSWARLFFRNVCHAETDPGESWRTLPPPAEDDLSRLVASAPPMVGLEFVTIQQLQQSWQELCQHVRMKRRPTPRGRWRGCSASIRWRIWLAR